MKVLAFQASPRIGGNTEVLLGEALKPFEEAGHDIQLLVLNRMKISPCQDCGGCNAGGVCVMRDDMDLVYDGIRGADRIVLASPIFFFALSSQAKAMIDRCQAFWCEKYLLEKTIPPGPNGRKGLLLVVGGMKKEIGVKCSDSTAKAFFRTISVPENETLSFLGIDAKGEIYKHPTALRDAYEAGKRLAE